jgi:hypothetical protein
MTQDEIIEMARQADPFGEHGRLYVMAQLTPETLEAFAKLVAAKEREACAKVCEEEGKLWSKAGCTDTQTFGLCATVIRARGEA